MRISTNEFLLGSLNDLLTQQQNVNQLNREIATGETMLDASDNPGGASQVIGLASQIGAFAYDKTNGQAATQTLQTGVSALDQVSSLLTQLRQTVTAATNGTTTPNVRSAGRHQRRAIADAAARPAVEYAGRQWRLPLRRHEVERARLLGAVERPGGVQRRRRRQPGTDRTVAQHRRGRPFPARTSF